MAPIQEGGRRGKPIICSDIEPAREDAKLLDMDICFFDPNDPEDIARRIVDFENDIDRYRSSSERASRLIRCINASYTGRCYAEVLSSAAGLSGKPDWAPFRRPGEDAD